MFLNLKFVQPQYTLTHIEMRNNQQTIENIKTEISQQLNITNDRIKIVYLGKILKDTDTIEKVELKDNSAIHIVISKSKNKNQEDEYTKEQTDKIETLLNLQIIQDKKQITQLLKDNQWNIEIVSNLLFEYME